MREILFKAKRKDNGKWIEGYYQKRYDLLGNEEHLIFHADSYNVWEYAEIDQKPSASSRGFVTRTVRRFGKMTFYDSHSRMKLKLVLLNITHRFLHILD